MTKTIRIEHAYDETTQILLRSLEEIEAYGDTLINKTKGRNRRKIFVLGIFAASIQYASAVRRLNMDRPSAKISNVFLRSLFEAWGNLGYITLRDDDWFVLEDLKESYWLLKKNQEYKEEFFVDHNVKKIGSLNLNQVRANITKSEKHIDLLQKSINVLNVKRGVKYEKNMYDRFKAIDSVKTPKEIETATYFSYLSLYNHLSASVHLGVEGAIDWIYFDKNTIRTNFKGEEPADIKRVLWTALALIFDITIITMKEFDLYDHEFDNKYQEIIDESK